MSDHAGQPHASDAMAGAHGTDDHGDGHGHDDHAHESEALGPIDITAWGAGLLGIVLGLVVAFCLAMSSAVA